MNYVGSQSEISEDLEISSTAVSKHIKRLLTLGIIEPAPIENGYVFTTHKRRIKIERLPHGREVLYRMSRPKNPNKHLGFYLGEIIDKYQNGITDETINHALEFLELVNPNRKKPRVVKTREFFIKRFEKRMQQVFPHPYHV